jgi:hypothetical protein
MTDNKSAPASMGLDKNTVLIREASMMLGLLAAMNENVDGDTVDLKSVAENAGYDLYEVLGMLGMAADVKEQLDELKSSVSPVTSKEAK